MNDEISTKNIKCSVNDLRELKRKIIQVCEEITAA